MHDAHASKKVGAAWNARDDASGETPGRPSQCLIRRNTETLPDGGTQHASPTKPRQALPDSYAPTRSAPPRKERANVCTSRWRGRRPPLEDHITCPLGSWRRGGSAGCLTPRVHSCSVPTGGTGRPLTGKPDTPAPPPPDRRAPSRPLLPCQPGSPGGVQTRGVNSAVQSRGG